MSVEKKDAGCVACGEPRSEHIGPPSPPLTRGHLGVTESSPGSCRTTTGVHVHNREKAAMITHAYGAGKCYIVDHVDITDEMVERAALAIAWHDGYAGSDVVPSDVYRHQARVVLREALANTRERRDA